MEDKMKTKTQKQTKVNAQKKLWKKNSTEWILPPCLPPIFSFETEQSRPYICLGVKLPADNTATHWLWYRQSDVSTNRNALNLQEGKEVETVASRQAGLQEGYFSE